MCILNINTEFLCMSRNIDTLLEWIYMFKYFMALYVLKLTGLCFSVFREWWYTESSQRSRQSLWILTWFHSSFQTCCSSLRNALRRNTSALFSRTSPQFLNSRSPYRYTHEYITDAKLIWIISPTSEPLPLWPCPKWHTWCALAMAAACLCNPLGSCL